MKRTSYNHLTAAIIGSRDQLCIHPEVSKETNNTNKVLLLVILFIAVYTMVFVLVLDSHVQTKNNNKNMFILL